MFVSPHLDINSLGHLTIGGEDTVELAERYGTPLYLMSEEELRDNCRQYRRSMEEFYGGRGLVAYASKALCCKAVCRLVAEEGLGLDVVSAGELYTARAAGVPGERLILHGNNKTPDELAMALDYGVGRIVVDNLTELRLLDTMAAATGKRPGILLRVKPGIDAHTHSFIRTGQIDSKFGFALETGEAMAAVKEALAAKELELRGLHCHIGSQIFDIQPFCHAARVMLELMDSIRRATGTALPELDLGGGFGIPYIPDNDPVPYSRYMEEVSRTVKEFCGELDFPMPFVIIEPGRSIVGTAGVTLYRVGGVKEIPGVRTYVSVDGSMADAPRHALYQADYTFLAAARAGQPPAQVVTVAGKCCESGDLLGENVPLQPVAPGDLVAMLSTGAYHYSMASNYNRIPRPAMVLVGEKGHRLIIRRETLEDLVRNDLD